MKNTLKEAFNAAYIAKKYNTAIELFDKIETNTKLIEPELRLDAANAYYIEKDTLNARKNYELCVNFTDNNQSALALNQLGNLALMQGDSSKAINFYHSAIEKNNELESARYNYELIRKLFNYQTSPPKSENQKSQNVEIEQSSEREKELDAYKPKNMSKEKALQLLEDLKSSELKISINTKNTGKKIEKDW